MGTGLATVRQLTAIESRKARSAHMRNRSLRRLLLDAWRHERSKDPEQDTTLDLLAAKRLGQEIDRLASRAAALHLATRAELRAGDSR